MFDNPTETLASDLAKHRSAWLVPKSKTEILRKLLARRTGATVVQIQKQLGWQPHTIRAAISRLRSSGLYIYLDRSGRMALYRLLQRGDR